MSKTIRPGFEHSALAYDHRTGMGSSCPEGEEETRLGVRRGRLVAIRLDGTERELIAVVERKPSF